jgi:hypothetical protein
VVVVSAAAVIVTVTAVTGGVRPHGRGKASCGGLATPVWAFGVGFKVDMFKKLQTSQHSLHRTWPVGLLVGWIVEGFRCNTILLLITASGTSTSTGISSTSQN